MWKKENPIGYCLFPILVFLTGKQIAYELFLRLLPGTQTVPLANGLAAAVMIPVMWKCFVPSTPEEKLQAGQLSKRQKLSTVIPQLCMFGLLGIGFCLAGNGLLQLTGLVKLFHGDYGSTMEALYGGDLWGQIFWIVIAAPIGEELVYRKILYGRMREYCGFWKGAAGASLLFGITHGFILQGVYSFLLGMLLCFLTERYRKLYPAILVHMSANLCSVVSTACVPVQDWLSDEGRFAAAVLVSVLVCITVTGYLAGTAPSQDRQS